MNQLSCQSCGSPLEVEGFDRRLAVVHCSHCGVLYDLTKPRARLDAEASTTPSQSVNTPAVDSSDAEADHTEHPRAAAAMPPGFSVTGDGQLSVRWSWRSTSNLFLLGIAVCWLLIPVFQFDFSELDWLRGAFVLVGLGMLYRGFAGAINSTTITVDENRLTVRHSPLPWFPAPSIDASSIEQLFVSEGFAPSKNDEKTPYYLLNAVLRDNTLERLSTRFPDIEQALFLEQEFERVLHIRDRSVAGEVRGATRHV